MPSFSIEIEGDASCLNDIYDKVFVISSPNRQQTLSITLFQLKKENISFILWECHSSKNVDSVSMYNSFKHKIRNNINIYNKTWNWKERDVYKKKISVYHKENIFYLRQTQIDILKYSLLNNLSKILLFEDDILIANTKYFQQFCKIEPLLPYYFMLNIGVNQQKADKHRNDRHFKLFNIQNAENSLFKYFLLNSKSWGVFATAIQYEMYSILINLFDANNHNPTILPIDLQWFYNENNKTIINHIYNIYPTLVIPDISKTTLRSKLENTYKQEWYLKYRTLKNDKNMFSKYWNYRFSNHTKLTQKLQQIAFNKIPTFNEIIKNQQNKYNNCSLFK